MKIKMRYYNEWFIWPGRYQACGTGKYSGYYGYGRTEAKAIENLKKEIKKARVDEYPKEIEVDFT